VALVGLVTVASALALTPKDLQYNELTPPTLSDAQPTGTNQPLPAVTSGTLPFTGMQLGVVTCVGALLVAGGIGLRRLGRKSSQPER
jgi:hypothetical protein